MDSQNSQTTPATTSTTPTTPTTGPRERGNDTSRSAGRSGRQKAATRRNMRREERVTVQGPVKEQQPDRMSHRGFGSPPGPGVSLGRILEGPSIEPLFEGGGGGSRVHASNHVRHDKRMLGPCDGEVRRARALRGFDYDLPSPP